MIIVAGGDSFIYGSELKDCYNQPSQNTFAALLTQEHEYRCVAWPGYANDSIARTVIAECENLTDNVIVIVSWTFPGRYEFRFSYDTMQRKSPWHSINSWDIQDIDNIELQFNSPNKKTLDMLVRHKNNAEKSGISNFAQVFYEHVGLGEYWETYSTLKEIVYLQNYLKVNNIPYMFTCADTGFLYNYTINTADEFISSLYKQIDMTKWFLFPAGIGANKTETPRGFYQWAVENKYAMVTTHPLEQAHAAATELIQGKFNELVTQSI
jgi:hypothetical protein